jgi:hypothetical protein
VVLRMIRPQLRLPRTTRPAHPRRQDTQVLRESELRFRTLARVEVDRRATFYFTLGGEPHA